MDKKDKKGQEGYDWKAFAKAMEEADAETRRRARQMLDEMGDVERWTAPRLDVATRTEWLRDRALGADQHLVLLDREIGLLLLTRTDVGARAREAGMFGYLVAERVADGGSRTDAAATTLLVDKWSTWRGKHDDADVLRLRALIDGLHAARGSLLAVADALAQIRARADPDLDEMVHARTTRLATRVTEWTPDEENKAQRAILRNVALFLAADGLAFTLATWRTRIDDGAVARAAASVWRALAQREDEPMASFLARLDETYCRAAMGTEASKREIFERTRPAVRAYLEKEINEVLVNMARHNTAVRSLLDLVDAGTVMASYDWLLAPATLPADDFREVLAWVDRRAARGRTAPEIAELVPTKEEKKEKGDKKGKKNNNIVCAACNIKGHPFFLCRKSTEEQKVAAAARIGYKYTPKAGNE